MDHGGLKQVLQDLRPALIRYLIARGQSHDDAEDLLQDVFLKLEMHRGGPVDEPRAYLYRMTHNLFLDRKRSMARRIRREDDWAAGDTGVVSEVDERPSAEDVLIARERLATIARALETLPERTQHIFRRFRLDGATQKAIAEELGLSRSAVEKHIYRAYRVVNAAKDALDAEEPDTTSREQGRHIGMSDDHDR